jgi:phosphoglycerate dehydrogenase-like enzyme
MPNVLVTAAFGEGHLERLRRISPRLTVTRTDPDTADYSRAEILYATALPRDRSRAPNLKWVQVHMAGVNGLHEHPLYADAGLALTTASGVHAATVAEYAITALLARRWPIAYRAWSSGRDGASGRPTSSGGRCSCRRRSAAPRWA